MALKVAQNDHVHILFLMCIMKSLFQYSQVISSVPRRTIALKVAQNNHVPALCNAHKRAQKVHLRFFVKKNGSNFAQ